MLIFGAGGAVGTAPLQLGGLAVLDGMVRLATMRTSLPGSGKSLWPYGTSSYFVFTPAVGRGQDLPRDRRPVPDPAGRRRERPARERWGNRQRGAGIAGPGRTPKRMICVPDFSTSTVQDQ